jgi:hypothetical protein
MPERVVGALIPELDYDPDEGEPPIMLSWEQTHRIYHHDRPAPDYYTPEMKAIWDSQPRSHPDCSFCSTPPSP